MRWSPATRREMRCALVALDDARVGFKLECALRRSDLPAFKRSSVLESAVQRVQDLETKAPSEQGEHRVMTLTKECEEANQLLARLMPAGFLAPSTGWGLQATCPRVPYREKSGKVATRSAVVILRWEAWWTHYPPPPMHVGVHTMRVAKAPHRLLAIAG